MHALLHIRRAGEVPAAVLADRGITDETVVDIDAGGISRLTLPRKHDVARTIIIDGIDADELRGRSGLLCGFGHGGLRGFFHGGNRLGLSCRDLRFRLGSGRRTLQNLGGSVWTDHGHKSLLLGAGRHDHGDTLVGRRRPQVALAFQFNGQRPAAHGQRLLGNDDECAIVIGDRLANFLAIKLYDNFRSCLGGSGNHGLTGLFNSHGIERRHVRLF